MTQISSDVIRGYNDTMILYLLLDEPSYGYEISKQIKALSDEKYCIKETTLYSAFTRMAKNADLLPHHRCRQAVLPAEMSGMASDQRSR